MSSFCQRTKSASHREESIGAGEEEEIQFTTQNTVTQSVRAISKICTRQYIVVFDVFCTLLTHIIKTMQYSVSIQWQYCAGQPLRPVSLAN